MPEFIDALQKVACSDQSIVTEAQEKSSYEIGARGEQGWAALVLRPASNDELSGMVATCVQSGVHIVPQSANTGVVSGSTPDTTGEQVILSLDRMRALFELDVINRTVHVGAGLRLSEINTRLQKHGLFFPIDLGADPMVGGMLSTNTGGARFLRYGDVRANTLGLKVVLGDHDGTVLDLCNSLRKNNVGVNWKHIFVGTTGVFGIVTEAVLNLEYIPQQTAVALLIPNSLESVPVILLEAERKLGPHLSAFEYMSGNAISAAIAHAPNVKNPFTEQQPEFTILVEINRTWKMRPGEETIDEMLQSFLVSLWENPENLISNALTPRAEEAWSLRHAISEGVRAEGYLIAFDLAFKRGRLLEFIAYAKQEIPKLFPQLRFFDFGHLGDGGVHFNLVANLNDLQCDIAAYEAEVRDWVIETCVTKFEGSFSGEHGIGRKNQIYYNKYISPQISGIGAGLKQVLSPGRLGVADFFGASQRSEIEEGA